MIYRDLGKTGLKVSEIGLGGEWLEKKPYEYVKQVVDRCEAQGINILDCWMSEPEVRANIGKAIAHDRKRWIIQGHIGSTWQNGQYERTRDMSKVKPAFEDLLRFMQTDYIDLGMIHFIDEVAEFERVVAGEFMQYVRELKACGKIKHIGLSTHNPTVGQMAAKQGEIEVILFSCNPAFDMLPASENIDDMFKDEFDGNLSGIAPERADLYKLCEQRGVGITVMKGYAGGRLFNDKASPFGVALTPIQCLHYALTRPAVCSVMVGYGEVQHVDQAVAYETATEEQKDYATVLAGAPLHSYRGQCTYCGHCAPCPVGIDIPMMNKLYDLATMQDSVPESLRAHYMDQSVKASDCIACGGCESRCPFSVSVIERMGKAKQLFEGK